MKRQQITTRMNRIIKTICTEKETTLFSLSQKLEISSRQLRYDFDKINTIIDSKNPTIETDLKGKIIIHNKRKLFSLIEDKNIDFKCTRKQRIEYILVCIAFSIKNMNLNQISKTLEISRTTIKNDLDIINKILKGYELNLIYHNQEYQLIGKQKDIFDFRREVHQETEYLLYKTNLEKIDLLISEQKKEAFNHTEPRKIIPIISKFIETNHIVLNNSQKLYLNTSLLNCIYYAIHQIELPFTWKNQERSGLQYDQLFSDLSTIFHVDFPQEEKNKIKTVLSIIEKKNNKTEENDKDLIYYLYHLIRHIDDKFHLSYRYSSKLIHSLFNHLKNITKYKNQGIEFPYLETYQVDLDEEIKNEIKNYCLSHNDKIHVDSMSDIKLVQIYFALESEKQKKKEKRVLLVSTVSSDIRLKLVETLEKNYDVKVVDVISRIDLFYYTKWDHVDVILFTEIIPNGFDRDIKKLRINAILNEKDTDALYNVGIRLKSRDLDFRKVYQELNFLKEDDRKSVISVLKQHFVVHHEEIHFLWQPTLKVIEKEEDLDYDKDTLIQINNQIYLTYEINNEDMQFLMKDNHNSIIIKIVSNNPDTIINQLFYLSDLLKTVSLSKDWKQELTQILYA